MAQAGDQGWSSGGGANLVSFFGRGGTISTHSGECEWRVRCPSEKVRYRYTRWRSDVFWGVIGEAPRASVSSGESGIRRVVAINEMSARMKGHVVVSGSVHPICLDCGYYLFGHKPPVTCPACGAEITNLIFVQQCKRVAYGRHAWQ